MQTIKVTIKQRPAENSTVFSIDNKVIAMISPDFCNRGKFSGSFGAFGCCNNSEYTHAVEFIGDCISNHFATFGLNVEFN